MGRRSRGARTVGLLAMLATSLAFVSAAQAHVATKVVRYHGYSLTVPSSWPVFRLAVRPSTCVRFNRHAVYLGAPSAEQQCPPAAAGRTEAILVEPTRWSRVRAAPPSVLPGAQRAAAEIAVPGHGVAVLGTWANDPAVIERALGLRSLSAVRADSVKASTSGAHAPRANATTAGTYTGLGFDACSAPSTANDVGVGFVALPRGRHLHRRHQRRLLPAQPERRLGEPGDGSGLAPDPHVRRPSGR